MPRSTSAEEKILPGLEVALYSLTNESLELYASVLPGKVYRRKAEMAGKIFDALSNPAEVRRLLETMSEQQRQVLSQVAHDPHGVYDATVIGAKYPGVDPPLAIRSSYYYFGSGAKKREPLPFDIFFYSLWPHGIFIPPDLAALLRSLLPPPPPSKLKAGDRPPEYHRRGKLIPTLVSDSERAVLHDLAATLDFVQQGKAAISATSRLPTLSTVRQLRERLLVADYFPDQDYARAEDAIRPTALIMLVQGARWAAPNAGGGKLELTKAGQALIGVALQPKHVREAWERWLKTDVLDELSRVKGVKGQQSKRVRLTKPGARRDKIAEALQALQPGRWIEFAEVMRYMRAEHILPNVERGQPCSPQDHRGPHRP